MEELASIGIGRHSESVSGDAATYNFMDVVGVSEDVGIVDTLSILKLEIDAGLFTARILVDVAGDSDDVASMKCFVEVNLDVPSIAALFFTHVAFFAVDA